MIAVKIDNISKSYDNHNIFDNFSLEINKGEFVIISGKSGSGKSTLCNIIGLLDKPDKGKIFIEDEEINYKSKQISNLLSKKISYLFQNFALIDNATIGYNLELVYPSKRHRKSKKKLIEEKLKKVGLEDSYDKLVYECSGGQQQRVAIARLLLKQGDIIICDEPTGSLDDENKILIMELISKMHAEGKTIIIVTHDKTLFSYADRIITI